MSTMSPTLKNHVRVPFLVHSLEIRSRGVVPEGLQVGGQTDLTMLLEVAGEGILSIESARYPLKSSISLSIEHPAKGPDRRGRRAKRTRVPARRPYE